MNRTNISIILRANRCYRACRPSLQRAPQPDRLLEGEDPRTIFPQDARHWIAVYDELIDFKEVLLGRVRTLLATLPAAARQDVLDNDIILIEDQLLRYRRRLEFWYGRQWHLEGLSINDQARAVSYRDRSVTLTKREYQLLVMLVARSPRFTTATQLLAEAWHDSRLPEESLRTYIARVRSKLARLGVAAKIENRPRRGYALVFEETTGGPAPA